MKALPSSGVPTAAQVMDALTAYDRSWDVRYDVVDLANLQVGVLGRGAYVGAEVLKGTVDVNSDRDVKGQLTLDVVDDGSVVWEQIRVQPQFVLQIPLIGVSWTCPMGVYVPWFPPEFLQPELTTRTIAAGDRTVALLAPIVAHPATGPAFFDMAATDPYGVGFAAGTDVKAAVVRLCAAAGIAAGDVIITDPGYTLSAARTWNAGQDTLLSAINSLLGGVGQYSIWPDENGRFRSDPIPDFDTATPGWSYAVGDRSMLRPGIGIERDVDRTANIIYVSCDDPQRPPFGAVATNDDPASPISTVNVGPRPKYVRDDGLADQAAAVRRASLELQRATALYERVSITTLASPLHQCFDIVDVVSADYAARLHERNWSMVLDPSDNTAARTLGRVVGL